MRDAPIFPIAITIGSSAFRIDTPSGDFGRASTSSDLPAAIFCYRDSQHAQHELDIRLLQPLHAVELDYKETVSLL